MAIIDTFNAIYTNRLLQYEQKLQAFTKEPRKGRYDFLLNEYIFMKECSMYYVLLCNAALYCITNAKLYNYALVHSDRSLDMMMEVDHMGKNIYTVSYKFPLQKLLFGFSHSHENKTDASLCFERLGIVSPLECARQFTQTFGYDLRIVHNPCPIYKNIDFIIYIFKCKL